MQQHEVRQEQCLHIIVTIVVTAIPTLSPFLHQVCTTAQIWQWFSASSTTQKPPFPFPENVYCNTIEQLRWERKLFEGIERKEEKNRKVKATLADPCIIPPIFCRPHSLVSLFIWLIHIGLVYGLVIFSAVYKMMPLWSSLKLEVGLCGCSSLMLPDSQTLIQGRREAPVLASDTLLTASIQESTFGNHACITTWGFPPSNLISPGTSAASLI